MRPVGWIIAVAVSFAYSGGWFRFGDPWLESCSKACSTVIRHDHRGALPNGLRTVRRVVAVCGMALNTLVECRGGDTRAATVEYRHVLVVRCGGIDAVCQGSGKVFRRRLQYDARR